jgi:hypothetical protein
MARKRAIAKTTGDREPAVTGGISVLQERAIEYRAAGLSVVETARHVRRSEGHVRGWFRIPAVQAEYARRCAELTREIRPMLIGAAPAAIAVLVEIATARTEDGKPRYEARDRVAAAKAIVDRATPSEVEITGAEGGPIAVDVTSQSVTMELSKLFEHTPKEGT